MNEETVDRMLDSQDRLAELDERPEEWEWYDEHRGWCRMVPGLPPRLEWITPSEVMAQRNRLLEALQSILMAHGRTAYDWQQATEKAEAAIAFATQKPEELP